MDVTAHDVTDADTVMVPIGRPVWNTTTLVLDRRLRPVPIGVTGELYVGGAQLARGYVGRSALTAERFVAAPNGTRLYRTGDLVRWNVAGELTFLGRSDDQLSIRGIRVEPAEIDAALARDAGVQRSVTVVIDGRLIAYVVPTEGVSCDVAALRRTAREMLPRHLVPDDVVQVAAIPTTSSGKVDRRALPAPTSAASVYRAPATPTERTVAGIFAEVLGLGDRIGADDDFFALGGTSLTAARAVSRVRSDTTREVSLRTLFDHPDVSSFATALESVGESDTPPIGGRRPAAVPLSYAQRRMWFLDRYEPGSYLMPLALKLTGAVDIAALSSAVEDVLDRHEVLRTVYLEHDGELIQKVLDTPGTALSAAAIRPDQIPDRLARLRRTRFDLASDIPVRAELLTLSDTEHVLVLVLHHIAADGVSLGPLTRDLRAAYRARRAGTEPVLPELTVQYADFAVWQRGVLGDRSDDTSLVSHRLRWWQTRLDGLADVLDLPSDRPRPQHPTRAGGVVETTVDAATTAALAALGAAHRATLFMVFHAALAVALSRWTGSDDIAVGAPVSGRSDPALDGLVGLFVDTVVLRTAVDASESFATLVERSANDTLDAFAHSEVPFDLLVDEIAPPRTSSHHPLFQVVLAFQDADPLGARSNTAAHNSDDLDVEVLDVGPAPATFDLALDVRESDAGLKVSTTYSSELFDPGTVQRFTAIVHRVLSAVSADDTVVVGDVNILGTDDPVALSAPVTAETHRAPRVLADLLDDSSGDMSTPAIIDTDRVLSRADMAGLTAQWARYLIGRGVGPGTTVVIALGRSWQYFVAVHAVTRAGAAFLPIDLAHPTERLARILTDAAPAAILVRSEDAPVQGASKSIHIAVDDPRVTTAVEKMRDDPVSDAERIATLRPDHLAYIIYTSGSTGEPKGVAVTHTGLGNAVDYQRSQHERGPDTRVLAVSSPTFDASIGELILASALRAPLVVAPPTVFGGPDLASFASRHRVTHALMTPRALESMDAESLPLLHTVISAGEACPPSLVDAWAPGRRMINLYGPSEATVWSTSGDLVAGSPVTLGSPTLGIGAVIRDRRLHPVPVGVVGELYVSGPSLAQGYVGSPALTAVRFVATDGGARSYRTGDLMRQNAAGDLLYMGRSDHQVKLRGVRIEMGEIESALAADAAVESAAAAVIDDRIVAYVVPQQRDRVLDVAALSRSVTQVLPTYMTPSAIVVLDRLPLTTSGKLDRASLPRPAAPQTPFRAPSSESEMRVAAAFDDVLDHDGPIGLDDDFFALGGHSLSATRVAARLGVGVRALFDSPTVESLAERLGEARPSAVTPGIVRPDPLPLSFAQQRMWFLNRFDDSRHDDGHGRYTIPLVLRLRGELDTDALAAALHDVMARHEILRTIYPHTEGEPRQQILAIDEVGVPLEKLDDDDVEAAVAGAASASFDLTTDLPIRASLVAVDETEHVLVLCLHHIAADGWSMAPLARDLLDGYASRTSGVDPVRPALAVQYADHAVWQQRRSTDIASRLAYWTDRLAGATDVLALPVDRPRRSEPSHRGDRIAVVIPADVTGALREIATHHQATVFMVVHAAYSVALARWTGNGDIAVGSPVSGRGDDVLDDVVGMFVNTVVLRSTVRSTDSFVDHLKRVRAEFLSALAHSDVPFEMIVDAVDPVRAGTHHPLVQVMLAFQNQDRPVLTSAGLDIEVVDAQAHVSAPFDLTLDLSEVDDRLEGSLTYATDLFDRRTAQRFVDIVSRVLSSVGRRPLGTVGEVEILHPAERAVLLSQRGSSALPARILPEILADAVAADPTGPALIDGDLAAPASTMSYAELDARSNRWARSLISRGAGPGKVLAIAAPRSFDQITAVWACAKTGAAFLPIDPGGPADRLAHVVDEAAALLAITTGSDAPGLPA
ncbi:MAG: amino acid adenylation domain-containing protein, partial [Rhodococcus sp. (in: high G+C Gram-positive bacteria)]